MDAPRRRMYADIPASTDDARLHRCGDRAAPGGRAALLLRSGLAASGFKHAWPTGDGGRGGRWTGGALLYPVDSDFENIFSPKNRGARGPSEASVLSRLIGAAEVFKIVANKSKSDFSTRALRQCLPDIGLRNSKLPCDCGRLDACFEGGTPSRELPVVNEPAPSSATSWRPLGFGISYWFLLSPGSGGRRPRRSASLATAASIASTSTSSNRESAKPAGFIFLSLASSILGSRKGQLAVHVEFTARGVHRPRSRSPSFFILRGAWSPLRGLVT